ncbi:MAG: hypothetical protein LBF77_04460 [Spirochaetaceae bacterium]|nr:hypothetical protein [Spirochaetaceae bacterium]
MKKIILALVCLSAVFCLYAQDSGGAADVYDFDALYAEPAEPPLIIGDGGTVEETPEEEPQGFFGTMLSYLDNPKVTSRHLDRKRLVDVRLFSLEAGLGNNLIGLGEFFKKQIVIDLNKLNDRIDANGIGWNADFNLMLMQINVNPTQRWGGGFGVNTTGRFDLTIPKGLLDLIANGNESQPKNEGEFVVSGSVFYAIELNAHGTLPVLDGKLTIGFDPAYYSPLVYIPRSGINYTLDTADKLMLSSGGKFRAYTPVNTTKTSAGDFFSSGGVDFSLSAEYALFSRLDLGLSLSHIPLVPARLNSGYEFSLSNTEIINLDDINNIDLNNLIKTPELTGNGDFVSLPEIMVFRPLRFDFYNIFRPFDNDFLSVRPNIGFTALNASEEVYLNMGTRVTLDLDRIFAVYLDSGLEEGLWRHKMGFELNLRAFELDLEAGMRSQNYLASWTASGASVKLGIAFGW